MFLFSFITGNLTFTILFIEKEINFKNVSCIRNKIFRAVVLLGGFAFAMRTRAIWRIGVAIINAPRVHGFDLSKVGRGTTSKFPFFAPGCAADDSGRVNRIRRRIVVVKRLGRFRGDRFGEPLHRSSSNGDIRTGAERLLGSAPDSSGSVRASAVIVARGVSPLENTLLAGHSPRQPNPESISSVAHLSRDRGFGLEVGKDLQRVSVHAGLSRIALYIVVGANLEFHLPFVIGG